MFADAIGDLDAEERARLRALLTDQFADTGAVVQSLPRSEPQTARRSSARYGVGTGISCKLTHPSRT